MVVLSTVHVEDWLLKSSGPAFDGIGRMLCIWIPALFPGRNHRFCQPLYCHGYHDPSHRQLAVLNSISFNRIASLRSCVA